MRDEASGGRRERRRGEREGRGRKGDREGGKLQGRYPEEDTGQYTLYSSERTNNIQHTTHNAALAIATLVLRVSRFARVSGLRV